MQALDTPSPFSLLKLPSAWVPLALSFAAILLLLGFVIFVGKPQTPPTDEGVGAHLFQLLMGAQLPIVAYFMIRWLPKYPAKGALVLALIFIGWVAAFVPVYLAEHYSSLP